MKTKPILINILVSTIIFNFYPAISQTQVNDWENPKLVGLNREAPHAIMQPYIDTKAALAGD